MPTRTVTRLVSGSLDLATALDSNSDAAVAALKKRFAEYGVPMTADFKAVFTDLAALTREVAKRATATDETWSGDKPAHKQPAEERDTAVADLREGLRDYRIALTARYGNQIASAFPAGGAPSGAKELVRYASEVASNVSNQVGKWKPKKKVSVTVDVPAATATLAQLTADAQTSIGTADAQAHDGHSDKIARDTAVGELRQARQGGLDVGVGLLEAAGQTALAEHMATHHHTGHHADAGGTPPPAATGPTGGTT
jgi:hypothetical protein